MSHYDDYVYQGGPFFGTRADTGLSAPTCFGSITYLSHYPDSEVALSLLHDVVAYVTPLMERRGYYVKELAEFRPVDGGLQGQNHLFGTQICIRLRQHPSFGPEPWRPFEDILDTMLHELAHMKHTSHDDAFMALWNTHRAELWDLANHHRRHHRVRSRYADDDLALASSSHGRHNHRQRGGWSERRHHRRRRTERRITVPDPDREMSCCGCAGERGGGPRHRGQSERGRDAGAVDMWRQGAHIAAAAAEHESDYQWTGGLQRNGRTWGLDRGYVDDWGQGTYPSGEYSTEYGFDSSDGLVVMAGDVAVYGFNEVLGIDIGAGLGRSVPVAGSD